MKRVGERFLIVYSGVLTVAFAATVAAAWLQPRRTLAVEQLDVQRINVHEADGTLRLVVSGRDRAPGVFIKGREYPHPAGRKSAGMLFYNDEGTENGGLQFGGERSKDGSKHSSGHLSFDAYEQDQTMALIADQDGGKKSSRLEFMDRPDYSVLDLVRFADTLKGMPEEEKQKRLLSFVTEHGLFKMRILLGQNEKEAMFAMCDGEGHPRIVMKVAADGTPSIQMMDASGHVVSELGQHG
ncbi:hypothetical protein [Luteibacter yeojuensis]